jgi:hypothetical protein
VTLDVSSSSAGRLTATVARARTSRFFNMMAECTGCYEPVNASKMKRGGMRERGMHKQQGGKHGQIYPTYSVVLRTNHREPPTPAITLPPTCHPTLGQRMQCTCDAAAY